MVFLLFSFAFGWDFGQCSKKQDYLPRRRAYWFYLLRIFFGYLGLLLPIALFVVYAFAVQSVANIMKELEDAGYVMDIAPTRIPKQISGICILGLFFAAALL